MAKTRSSMASGKLRASPTSTTNSRKPKHLILRHEESRILINCPPSWAAAVQTAEKHFPQLRNRSFTLQTDELDICNNELVEITAEVWDSIIDDIKTLWVKLKFQINVAYAPAAQDTLARPAQHIGRDSDRLHINVKTMCGMSMKFEAKFYTPMSRIRSAMGEALGKEPEIIRLMYDGCRVSDEDTPYSLSMDSGDLLFAMVELVGGKPVIYLFSPTEQEVAVTISLVPQWSFSAIYPVVPIEQEFGKTEGQTVQKVQWDVLVHKDGSLTEKATQLDVAYLFWEAHTNADRPLTPPASPSIEEFRNTPSFNPATADLSPDDSVVLSVSHITPYLDKALLALGLHTEARTSFITYWLPSLLKHSHVALRFLRQEAYERAAPLDVVPAPDVVTRVFMLFKGIDQESLRDWSAAQDKAKEDVQWWRDIVGVDLDKAGDGKLFRVLEWGGMEVLRP